MPATVVFGSPLWPGERGREVLDPCVAVHEVDRIALETLPRDARHALIVATPARTIPGSWDGA